MKLLRGATLLELIIVVILIFVLAGVIAPRFSDFLPEQRVRSTTDQILATLLKARADSALLGVRYRFHLDTDEADRRFWLDRETRPLKEPEVFTELGDLWSAVGYPEDVSITAEGLRAEASTASFLLEFRPDGTAGSDAALVIRNERGDQRTIKVAAATGKVTVE